MKKLKFRKETVSMLNANELDFVKGGKAGSCLGPGACKNSEFMICIGGWGFL